MINIEELDRPRFVLFPFNNNRTAWRPISFPAVLVVPYGINPDGSYNNDAQVFYSDLNAIKISIEGAPERARVAGHTNVGKYVPEDSLYTIYLTYQDLYNLIIIPSLYPLYDKNGEPTTDFTKAKYFEYTTGSGSTELLEYLTTATYYDLSTVQIPTEAIPNGNYFFSYETFFYIRQTLNDQLVCIDKTSTGLGIERVPIIHPGDIMQEFYNLTPEPYLANTGKSVDTTVGLYRPFTDILQDIFDEQAQLEALNWVFECQPQIIPYLSTMLGWEIPYYPASLDNLRKALLRRTVEFQNLKGSSKVISELFRLFGYLVFVDNLWYSTDGKRFIAPNEKLPPPYTDQQITTTKEYYTDIAYFDFYKSEFINDTIPLLHTPQEPRDLPIIFINVPSNITLYGIITDDTDTIESLKAILSSPIEEYTQYIGGIVLPTAIGDLAGSYSGLSSILFDGSDQLLYQNQQGRSPLNPNTINIDRSSNTISLSINTSLYEGEKLFVFFVYNRVIYNIPEQIQSLRSNRFTIKVFNEFEESVSQTTLDFLLEFLYTVKSFHSILNSVQNVANLSEAYLVTDMCVGGDFSQRYGTDLGVQQVPPAIIPEVSEGCKTPTEYGFKASDLRYRKEVYDAVLNEFEIAKSYDDRQYDSFDTLIPLPIPVNTGTCLYTPYNQDRIEVGSKIDEYSFKFDPDIFYNSMAGGIKKYQYSPGKANPTSNESTNNNSELYKYGEQLSTSNGITFCNTDGYTDHCYKGRVTDDLFTSQDIVFTETYVPRPCVLSLGTGCYYTYTAPTTINKPGTIKPQSKSSTSKVSFTGNAPTAGLNYEQHLFDITLDSSFLGRLTHNIKTGSQTLHYTDRQKIIPDQFQLLALQKPAINIDKSTLHIPGCRFPTIANLEQDYETSFIEAKPWDDAWSTYCGPISVCNQGPSFLNASMMTAEDGNEYLSYDIRDYICYGNNSLPDIGDLDSNLSHIQGESIIHRVYMSDINSNPAVSFESSDETNGNILIENGAYLLQEDGAKLLLEADNFAIVTATPRFSTAILCSDGQYHDDLDGYPSLWGEFTFINQDITQGGLYQEVLEGLGWTTEGQVVKSGRYYLGSGIFVENGLRLDCGCSIYTCEINVTDATGMTGTNYTSAEQGSTLCQVQTPAEMDDYSIANIIQAEEMVNAEEILLDGSIPSLFEITL